MTKRSHIHEFDGNHSLTFGCGDLPADAAVVAAGHEPNGYFWEGIAALVAAGVVERVELDSEGGAFHAYGSPADLAVLQDHLEPLLVDGTAVQELIARAEASGFAFDD